MRRIAIVNQKGGCGKTTTTINLAMSLALRRKRVLLIDLDPQGHISAGLGVRTEDSEKSICEVLLGEIPIIDAIQPLRKNLDGVLSDIVLSGFEQLMAGIQGREYKLAESLKVVDDTYDFLIVDSPPSLGLLTFNALLAADELIIPVDASVFALNGLGRLMETIQMIQKTKDHQFSLRLLAVNIDRRTRFGRNLIAALKTRFPEHSFKTVINTCTAIRESSSLGMPIHEHNRRCAAFRDYPALADEVLREKKEVKLGAFSAQDVALEESAFGSLLGLTASGESARSSAERMVEFAVDAPERADVKIAGDFNGWSPEALKCTESNGKQRWYKSFSLRPGVHEYKYVINGKWMPDAGNKHTVDDKYGGKNSVINV
jgi:chromosome partitioning protein